MDQGDGNTTYPTNFAAPSVQSSRMTDVASEDADEYYPEGAAAKKLQSKPPKKSVAGSNRPSSPPSSFYSKRSSTRRGFGGPGLSMANSNRVNDLQNRNSITHAPSVTSHAFFRPMSSQRLQAQRTPRPNTGTQASSRLSSTTMERRSIESIKTASQTSPRRREYMARPSSRGSEFTDADIRDRATSHMGNGTIQSTAESTSLLQGALPPPQNGTNGTKAASAFQANFSRYPKDFPALAQSPSSNHERSSNDTSSPQLREKVPPKPSTRGRNYEYFSGNTAFCWGGRLQNTRHRPINVLSGVLIVVPVVLFFVFEYVV